VTSVALIVLAEMARMPSRVHGCCPVRHTNATPPLLELAALVAKTWYPWPVRAWWSPVSFASVRMAISVLRSCMARRASSNLMPRAETTLYVVMVMCVALFGGDGGGVVGVVLFSGPYTTSGVIGFVEGLGCGWGPASEVVPAVLAGLRGVMVASGGPGERVSGIGWPGL